MKTSSIKTISGLGCAVAMAFLSITGAEAQSKTSSTVYVYPSKGQSASQQRADEQACHNWAVKETGINPDNVSIQADDDPDVNGGRKIVLNTAGGAAVGAGVSAIAGDASKGAAIGAAAGATRGIFKRRSAKRKARQENANNAAYQTAELNTQYIKAYSACLEGKGYSVK